MNTYKLSRFHFIKICVVSSLFFVTLTNSPAPLRGEGISDPKTEAAIKSMHDEIQRLKVTVERNSKSLRTELKPEPILHYTDPQRHFPDATLWVWMLDGRPVLFSKCERLGGTLPQTQFCITCAHEPRVAVRRADGTLWKSRSAGIEFQKLAHDEQPQKTPQLRVIQLRGLAKRFRGVTTDRENQKEEMRLLSQPILRYSNADQSLVDGAVFAIVSNGTNPDALLVIQVSRTSDGNALWEYGCVGMSGDAVSIELEGKPAYKHESKISPGDHGYWLWTVVPTD